MRKLQAFVVVGALVGVAAASASGPAPSQLRHPNPLLTNLSLDYVDPIPAAGGGSATLAPLDPAVIEASVRDLAYLRYQRRDDWGGFASPPRGGLAVKTGGAVIVGSRQQAGVPLFERLAGGSVNSYTRLHGIGPSKRPARSPTPRVPQPPLPTSTPLPCANSGFGGTACNPHAGGHRHSGGGATGPAGNPGGGNSNGGKGECGTAGLSIVSNLANCVIRAVHAAAGDSAFEHLTITNTSSQRYTVSFEASGAETPLWDALELGVWQTGSAAPTPLPPLRFWTTQFTQLVTLAPGKAAHFTVELYLPATAGNGLQHESAAIDFNWRAVG